MAEPGEIEGGVGGQALNKAPQYHVSCVFLWVLLCLCAVTHSAGALRVAVSAQVEAALPRRHGHDRCVDQAQLHNAGIVAPQVAGEM